VKQILFVGKFNTIVGDINSAFGNLFNVQICVANVQMVKGMLKLKKPELVVVSLMGISEDASKIFEELKYNYSKMPVICIGSDEEVNAHFSSMNTSQFTTLITPVGNEQILDTIYRVSERTHNDNRMVADNDGRKNILIVDDSNVQLRALNELLKDKYRVRMATSGMQALTMIGKEKPDMIFLDYEMPICDGRMTLEMIRELDEAKDIPVVFLTGVSDKKHIEAVLDLEPEGYLLKPANASRIYKIIEKILG
jgi:DNA-binding NtrC family response regulator